MAVLAVSLEPELCHGCSFKEYTGPAVRQANQTKTRKARKAEIQE